MDLTGWNGVDRSYLPPPRLDLGDRISLYDESVGELDPVLYEVIRYNLWNINLQHGDVLLKISGSPIAFFAHDFNTSLLTHNGEYIYSGPYNQNLSGVLDLPIKWTLENRTENPGIQDGDMFLSNDPWIGASHVTDAILLCPVFHEGRLFCWVANSFHQYDMGGSAPGGYTPEATSRFDEADPMPPIKIVEGGVLRKDIEGVYLRKSRTPDLVALDLRSQIAGCNFGKSRVHGLIERYGAATVQGVIQRIIRDAEEAFVRRIKQIPDGVWREQTYLDVALPGDRKTYRVVLTVTKEDDKITFENEGTEEQSGVLNVTYSGWRSGIMATLNASFCWDLLFAIGGPLRHLDFIPTPGTILCADPPAPVANVQIGICQSGAMSTRILSKMMYTVPELRKEAFSVSGTSQYPINALSGVDQWGQYFGTIHLDPMGGGFGAFDERDGVDVGGVPYDITALLPNVEFNEQLFPILYLYRREVPGGGGAGRMRGGNSGEYAYVPHGTEEIAHYTATCGTAVMSGLGSFGGLPGNPNQDILIRDSDVKDAFSSGRIPQDAEAAGGLAEDVPPKIKNIVQGSNDVWIQRWCGSGGFGDPLEREAAQVLEDLLAGRINEEAASNTYSIRLTEEGELDTAATERARKEARAARLASAQGPWSR